MFKKIDKENKKFHHQEMEYLKKLEKKMKRLEKRISKKDKSN